VPEKFLLLTLKIMNKKFIQAVAGMCVFALIIAFMPTGYANEGSSGNGYNTPVYKSELNFKAEYSNGKVTTGWSDYKPEGFDYYKVIRSTSNPNPVYPDDGYIYYGDSTSYVDPEPPTGVVYYRVCSIAGPNRYCSTVIKINSDGSSSAVTSKPDDSSDDSDVSISLSYQMKSDGISLSWAVDGYSSQGFKIAKSTVNKNPTYPVMDGDTYFYFSEPEKRSYTDGEVKAGKTYYYRVCEYLGGECGSYSNNIAVTVPSNFAEGDDEDEKGSSDIAPAVIDLKAELADGGAKLTWTVDGSAPYGFKVAESTVNKNPTYPVMSGDSYRYLSEPDVRSYTDVRVEPGKTYYYRVCQYLGGTCGSYSNAVSITVPEDFKSEYIAENVDAKKAAIDAKAEAFADAKKHKYNEAIDYLREQNVVEGYDDGTFKPDRTINRAEFMKIIIAAKFSQEYISLSMAGNCFSDVKSNQWFAPYICMAKNEGIVSGYPDGTFGPAKEISFVEAAKILAEVYNLDFTAGDSWYEGYVKALQDNNYIPDSVSALTKKITRAEMAELIWRIKMQKKQQSHATLLGESVDSGAIEGWATYYGDGFTVQHPNWHQGSKWGRDLLTDEKDFIDNINTPNYMEVDSYINIYTVSGSDLNTKVSFAHPLVSSEELVINGVKALKRHYRAPRGTVVNGRTTGENENITVYTYALDGKVAVLQYFNAYGSENYNVETFYKIAESFKLR
jgi:hypothetical protein